LTDVDRQLARLCGSIPYTSSGTVVFALRRDQIARALDGTGYVVPAVERRTVMAATWITSKWPGRAPPEWVLVRGFVGGARDAQILDRPDGELARAVFEDLSKTMGISGPPALTRIYRWPQANAQYHVGHLELIKQIDDRLQQLPGVYLTGSGYRGTGIPDCIADARATAEGVARFLGRA
jgi:oxygen-dependent protoporphyrinogen oxidase